MLLILRVVKDKEVKEEQDMGDTEKMGEVRGWEREKGEKKGG